MFPHILSLLRMRALGSVQYESGFRETEYWGLHVVLTKLSRTILGSSAVISDCQAVTPTGDPESFHCEGFLYPIH